jgi:Xaa-Pro aminopeptidase
MEREGVDAYFGVRRENTRYLTGFELADGEEKSAGNSGQFFVSGDEVVVLADSRYLAQAADDCPLARVERVYHDFPDRWPALIGSLRAPNRGSANGAVRRVAVEAGFVSHALWSRLAAATPEVELVPAEGWVEEARATKEPSEIERVAAACAVADAALERLLPRIVPGVTEGQLALQLEWDIRTSGAEALAFDVACLSGPRAALPHGKPGGRALSANEVVLFDFGAQVCGYRSDMTRTLFVGQPTDRDRKIYELVLRAQQAAIDAVAAAAESGDRPPGRAVDTISRQVIAEAGFGVNFGHGLGHGIGLATHELPSLTHSGPDQPLPGPTVFTIEPGVYLDGQTGVRIEDVVLFDPGARRFERLTGFPREITVVG